MTKPKTVMDKLKRTKWFRTRPRVVQRAHDIWSPGDNFLVEGEICYLLGFGETKESDSSGDPYDLMLILTKVDPTVDYDKAREESFRVCGKHFRSS